MKKITKKILSLMLALLMMITAVPLTHIESQAAGISGYSGDQAAAYAKTWWSGRNDAIWADYDLWGGDCANFISQCLYAGGVPMTSSWYFHKETGLNPKPAKTTERTETWTVANKLCNYLISIGGQVVDNPSASQISIGDVIFYDWDSDGRFNHSAICTGYVDGVPQIACHYRKRTETTIISNQDHLTTDWTLGAEGYKIRLVKLYGSTCYSTAPTYDVYRSTKKLRGLIAGSILHVTQTSYSNGNLVGLCKIKGVEQWVTLTGNAYYVTHVDSIYVTHAMGNWYTVSLPTCITEGKEQRVCSKCGYTETRSTGGGAHINVVDATCLEPSYCTACGTTISDPLGHKFGEWSYIIEPTCTEGGTRTHTCLRCGYNEQEDVDALGHDDAHVTTAPTCTDNGTACYECQRCGRQTVNYIDSENTISDWTAEVIEGLEPVETKIQYRYSDKSTTTSYSTSLAGWTQYGSEWVQSGSGDAYYVDSWPYGWSTSDWFYLNYRVGAYSAYETATTKRDVANSHAGYLNAHWCRGEYSSELNRTISQTYTSTYDTFHSVGTTDNKATSITENAYKYQDRMYCDNTYWWHINLQTPYYYSKYTDYNKLFYYYQWSDWSDWQDDAVSASDTRQVETRTVYKYDLAALGHDFSVDDDNSYVAPTCTEPGHTGVKCSRCGALSPDGKEIDPLGHLLYDEPEYTQSRDELIANGEEAPYGYWYFDSVNSDGDSVYRRDCGRECGYHEFKIEGNDTCIYELTDETERTCTQDHKYIYTCKDHGETMEVVIEEAYGHEEDGKWILTDAASCANGGKDGKEICYCVRYDNGQTCDKVFERTIPAPDHVQVTDTGKDPTCTQTGLTDGTHCSVCNEIITEQEDIEVLGHNDGVWICINEGYEDFVGTSKDDCDVLEVTCGTALRFELHCTRVCDGEKCNALLDEYEREAPECNFVETERVESTCTINGYVNKECTECGKVLIDFLDPLGHLEGDEYTVNATCTEEGYVAWDCQRDGCDYSEVTEVLEATGHALSPLDDGYDTSDDQMELISSVANICGDGSIDTYQCTHINEGVRCDYTVVIGNENDHSMGEWFTVTEPTCEDFGLERQECQNEGCTYYIENALSPIGHDYVADSTVDATCEENGYVHYVCQNDSSHTYDGDYFPALGHESDNNWFRTKAPTCTEEGEEQCYCVRYDDGETCEKIYTRAISVDPDAHEWNEGVVDPDATCNEEGTKTYTCLNDSSHTYTEDVAIDKNNHVGDTYIKDASEPTCTENGYTGDTYCSDCNVKIEDGDVIDSLGHNTGEWYTVTEATCTEEGLERRDCQRDGCEYYEERESAIDADNHKAESSYTIDVKADCENDGSKSHHCERCDEILDSVVIPAREHDIVSVTTSSTCSASGEIVSTCSHTDETDEYEACTYTDTQVIEIDPDAHDWGEWYVETEPTCNSVGVEKRICNLDSNHIETRDIEIDADNHVGDTYISDDKEPTCTEDGYTGDTRCSDCDEIIVKGEVIPYKGHDYIGVTTAPTCTEQGYTTYTCSECGDNYVDDYVVAHDHDYHLIAEKSKAPDYGVAGYDYYECSYDATHNYTVDHDPLVKTTYTATFVVTAPFFDEDKTVGTVTFEEGDKYVDEPSVESYKNYTFAWDEYELGNEDIVIYGRYTEIEIDGVSDFETNKTAEYNDGIATITLEAKADTKNIKVLSENTKPVDVVLVLDQSGSMAETLGGTNMTKQTALIDCANSFVNELYENAVATGADHRVALVGFAYSDYNNGKYQNTGILATTTGKSYNYANLTDSAFKTALIPVVSDNGINEYITNGINSVDASGATAADLGLEMANDIFAVAENDGTRERIVIFITDGTPTSWGETTSLVESISASAITQANRLKNQQGAKIYSVGVHANADPTAEFTSVDSGVTTDSRGNFESFDFNRFLHAVSSNYPESGSMKISDLGNGSKDSGYYMGVNDTSNLSGIFSKILYSAVYEINTFDKVTLVDTISKEFTLTLEQESEMRENLTSTLGIRNEDISVIRNEDGTTTVKFANVRATKVYNDDGSSYYSASVSFDVTADEDSLSGGNIATNTDDAYVEYGGEKVGSFTVPTVNIEQNRNIVVFTVNGVVYRIDEAQLGDNVVAPESELAKWNIPEGTVVTESCAYFEASEVSDAQYTVTWISEGKQETQTYTFGSAITAPEAGEKAEYDFLKWSPDVPATMPAYNMTFTAIYTPEHTHEFKKSYTYGDCESGLTTVYACSCGETKEETAETTEHICEAVVAQTNDGTLIERVSCTVCGKYVEQNLTYKVSYSQGRRITVLDLSLYENEVSVQPDGTIKIMFYLGSDVNKNYTVYRIDEDGNKTSYTPEKENGYLVFYADHFSIYVVTETDVENEVTYDEAICILNGHSYTSEVTAPTCTENGYTTYTCSNCGDTYTADETAATGHADNNGDGKCDSCGTSTTADCGCTCHSSSKFVQFFWKIIRFFYKLFGMNKTCDCGVIHY